MLKEIIILNITIELLQKWCHFEEANNLIA